MRYYTSEIQRQRQEKFVRAVEHKKESTKIRQQQLKQALLKGNADGAREL
jgi:hypothetical protein